MPACRIGCCVLAWAVALPAASEPAGPAVPKSAAASPAQQAIALYADEHGARPLPPPCRPVKAGEVVVCARDPAADRLPLPEERSARDTPRTAIGEPPRAAPAGLAQIRPAGTGLTLTLPLGGGKASVKGNGSKP